MAGQKKLVEQLVQIKEKWQIAEARSNKELYQAIEQVVQVALDMRRESWAAFVALPFWKGRKVPQKFPEREKRIRLAGQFLFDANSGGKRKRALRWFQAANILMEGQESAKGLARRMAKQTIRAVVMKPKAKLGAKITAADKKLAAKAKAKVESTTVEADEEAFESDEEHAADTKRVPFVSLTPQIIKQSRKIARGQEFLLKCVGTKSGFKCLSIHDA